MPNSVKEKVLSEPITNPVPFPVPETELTTRMTTPDGSTVESKAKGFSMSGIADEIKGTLGQWVKGGIIGAMIFICFFLIRSAIQESHDSRIETMGIINKTLDRLDKNQTTYDAKFELIQTESLRKQDKIDEKFEKMGKELQDGRKEHAEQQAKTMEEIKTGRKEMGDKLDMMIKSMKP